MDELGNRNPEGAEEFAAPEQEQKLEYPKGLTDKDIELIGLQCEHQQAISKEQLLGFANAYSEAKNIALNNEELAELDSDRLYDLILRWAAIIEPRNEKGFRTTPVVFQGGTSGLAPQAIPRQIDLLCGQFIEKGQTPTEIYKWFEEIHPFEDGNGRTGDLVWKLSTAHQGEPWPETLPPDVFDQPVEEQNGQE